MKNILDTIIEQKYIEVENAQKCTSIEALQTKPFFNRNTFSLKKSLLDKEKTGIIAEYKRQSPSKGIINNKASVKDVTNTYNTFGASGLSILTDTSFFGGNIQDLLEGRSNNIPILRKDFIIDPYQIFEAKAYGADVILLIAACLTPQQVQTFTQIAHSLALEVLLEIHSSEELGHICEEVDIVGVNNRNLKTFEVDIQNSINLLNALPSHKICIAESGIDNVNTVLTLKKAGFKGFLMGEHFMKNDNPGAAFAQYVNQLKQAAHES